MPDANDPAALRSRKELCSTLLARKHPVPFFQSLDCCARAGQSDPNDNLRNCSLLINACSKIGSKAMADLPSNPAATAALASAVASTVKLYVQQLQDPHTAATLAVEGYRDLAWKIGLGAPSKVPMLLLDALSAMLQHAMLVSGCTMYHAALEEAAVRTESSKTDSSSSTVETVQQQRASTLLLLVLVCRSLLLLHEALLQLPQMSGLGLDAQVSDAAGPTASAARMQQEFVTYALRAFDSVRAVLHICLKAQQAAAAADNRSGSQAAEHPAGQHASSSSSRRVRWQYLLRLQDSRKLMKALHTLDEVWCTDTTATANHNSAAEQPSSSSSPAAQNNDAGADSSEQPGLTQQQLQQFRAALRFCRVLVSVAPLPVVCNNPGCMQLGGASEAAAARFMCAGCGCRYCSAACQAAGWRGNKKACRRMADCGMRVQG
jgi:hypothetical protein